MFQGHSHGTPASSPCGSYSIAVDTHSEVHVNTHPLYRHIHTYTHTHIDIHMDMQIYTQKIHIYALRPTHLGMHVDMHGHTCMYTDMYTMPACTHSWAHMDAYANNVDMYLHKSAGLGPSLVHGGLQGTTCPPWA